MEEMRVWMDGGGDSRLWGLCVVEGLWPDIARVGSRGQWGESPTGHMWEGRSTGYLEAGKQGNTDPWRLTPGGCHNLQ